MSTYNAPAQTTDSRPATLGAMSVWVRFGAPTFALVGALTAAILVMRFGGGGALHAPNLSLIARASLPIRIHLVAAMLALGLGAVQMLAPKGTLPHRTVGWIWVVFMLTAALSSILIKVINPGHFSLIHILTAWTLIAAPLGVIAARRGKIGAHSRYMAGLFYMGLITAGAFTFLPGRLLYQVFFGH